MNFNLTTYSILFCIWSAFIYTADTNDTALAHIKLLYTKNILACYASNALSYNDLQTVVHHDYPLHYLCEKNLIDALKIAHTNGISLFVMDNKNNTLLHTAYMHKSYACAEYCRENKVDIQAKNSDGKTAEMLSPDYPAFKHLLALPLQSASTNAYTPNIILSAERKIGKTNRNEMKLTLIHQKPLFAYNKNFLTHHYPLHYLCEYNCNNELIFLHKQGFCLNLLDDQNNTLLHIACKNKNSTFVRYILEESIYDINCKNNQGKTPFDISYENNSIELIQLLLSHNASLDTFTMVQNPTGALPHTMQDAWNICALKRHISRDNNKEIPLNKNHSFWHMYASTRITPEQKNELCTHAQKQQGYSLTLP